MARAAASTWGPIVSTSSGASATTPTLASSPCTPSTGAATPYAPACNSPLLLTGLCHARLDRPGWPGRRRPGPADAVPRPGTRRGTASSSARPRPGRRPRRRRRRSDARWRRPASARRRSAGSAASASSGWARRARCSTPAPRRSRPARVAAQHAVLGQRADQPVDHRPADAERGRGLGDGQPAGGVGDQVQQPQAPVQRLRVSAAPSPASPPAPALPAQPRQLATPASAGPRPRRRPRHAGRPGRR